MGKRELSEGQIIAAEPSNVFVINHSETSNKQVSHTRQRRCANLPLAATKTPATVFARQQVLVQDR